MDTVLRCSFCGKSPSEGKYNRIAGDQCEFCNPSTCLSVDQFIFCRALMDESVIIKGDSGGRILKYPKERD